MKLLHKYIPQNSPFLLGFIISLTGALPLGYINMIALQIFIEQGNRAVISFISGIIFVMFFVLKAISYGAKWLVQQQKLLLFIDVFTIVFFTAIAYYFFLNINNGENFSLTKLQLAQFPFILGLLLNSLNFIQWPYWSGIYIYLFRSEKIKDLCNDNSIFILGAMLGTFAGMLIFAHIGNFVLANNKVQISNYLNIIFAILFSILVFGQVAQFFWKHKINKTQVPIKSDS